MNSVRWAGAIMALSLTGCGTDPTAVSSTEPVLFNAIQTVESEHEWLTRQIMDATPRRADSVEQCALLPVGTRPCGGPERYLAYSTRNLSNKEEDDLLEQAERHQELDRKIKADRGMVSTCEVQPPPKLALRDGFCTVKQTQSGFQVRQN